MATTDKIIISPKISLSIDEVVIAITNNKMVCNIHYISSNPENFQWGGGWVHKLYPLETPFATIILDSDNYYMWQNKGFYGILNINNVITNPKSIMSLLVSKIKFWH